VVEVAAAEALLQTEQSSVDQTVEKKLIEDLPLVDQNVMQLVQITPGVVSGNPGNPQAVGLIGNRSFFDSNFSVNGGRASTNDVLVDGVANTIGDFNGVGATPPARSVAGVQGDEWRGLGRVWSRWRRRGQLRDPPGWQRLPRLGLQFPPEQRPQREYVVEQPEPGDPGDQPTQSLRGRFQRAIDQYPGLWKGKDRTFFFANYEGRRNRDPFEGLSTVPTEKQRTGDFSETRNRAGALISVFNPVDDAVGRGNDQSVHP
jgi:hypothetical protein